MTRTFAAYGDTRRKPSTLARKHGFITCYRYGARLIPEIALPGGAINVIGRLMIRSQWSDDKAKQIESVVMRLYEEDGLRGDELYKKARELVIPQSSFSHIITLAKESDDAAFVERVMVKTFHRESPVRDVAIKRYCNRNCTQDIARIISYITGADIQYCRKRVVWCEKVLESEMFYAMKRELEKEFPLIAA